LQRRSDAARWSLTSLAAHPGWALTNLFANGPASEETPRFLMRRMRLGTRCFSRSAVHGAAPILVAATLPAASAGVCMVGAGCGGCAARRRWPASHPRRRTRAWQRDFGTCRRH